MTPITLSRLFAYKFWSDLQELTRAISNLKNNLVRQTMIHK